MNKLCQWNEESFQDIWQGLKKSQKLKFAEISDKGEDEDMPLEEDPYEEIAQPSMTPPLPSVPLHEVLDEPKAPLTTSKLQQM